jgi:hypothetical protein
MVKSLGEAEEIKPARAPRTPRKRSGCSYLGVLGELGGSIAFILVLS